MPQKKKPAEPGKDRAASARPGAVALDGSGPGAADVQLQEFERAIRMFHAKKFEEARELFQTAAGGPRKEIAYNSRLHVSMCDRRIEKPSMDLHSIEDHYNYAIERINARDLGIARRHLDAALELDKKADHVYYALALCCGLAGDLHGAYENLKHAIELHPANRLAARQDADFAGMANLPPLQQLLYP
ncbi:MAG: hypothetical protein M3Z85_04510 [Acidobacteriota bacterium]|nr:hypothetical protein [Acidobacteriota bacterium]